LSTLHFLQGAASSEAQSGKTVTTFCVRLLIYSYKIRNKELLTAFDFVAVIRAVPHSVAMLTAGNASSIPTSVFVVSAFP